jgi:hypothetical protein
MRRVGWRSMRRESRDWSTTLGIGGDGDGSEERERGSRDWSTKLGIGGDGEGSERRVAMTMKKESEGSHVAALILDA